MGTLTPISLKKDYKNRDLLDYDRWNEDQQAIENVANKLINSSDDGDSGADNIKMTPITDISPTDNPQEFLEAVVAFLLSSSSESYTKLGFAKALAKYTDTSGAEIIGSKQSGGLAGTTIHAQMVNLRKAIDQIVAGQIPVGSIDITKLTVDIVALLDSIGDISLLTTEDKTDLVAAICEVNAIAGVLANLKTLNKTSLVGAVNEVKDEVDEHKADYVAQPPYAVTTGSANTYAVTINPAPTAYVEGMGVVVKINANNTGASTINVNGLGAKTILAPDGSALSSGDLKQNSIYALRYNGVNFILQGKGGVTLTGNATVDKVFAGYTFYSNDPKTKLTGTYQAYALVAGGNYINEEISTSSASTTYEKANEMTVKQPGTVRVSFSIRNNSSGTTVYGKVYKNDAPVGIERTTTSNVGSSLFTEDFTVNANDKIQIYIKTSNASVGVWCTEFKIGFDPSNLISVS